MSADTHNSDSQSEQERDAKYANIPEDAKEEEDWVAYIEDEDTTYVLNGSGEYLENSEVHPNDMDFADFATVVDEVESNPDAGLAFYNKTERMLMDFGDADTGDMYTLLRPDGRTVSMYQRGTLSPNQTKFDPVFNVASLVKFDGDYIGGGTADAGELDTTPETLPDGAFGRLSESDGRYQIQRDVDDDGTVQLEERITSFVLDLNAKLFDDDGEEKFDVTVYPATVETTHDIQISPAVFNDVRTFREEVCRWGRTTFSGERDDLDLLRKAVDRQSAPRLKGTSTVGIHGEELVTPNGVISADGPVDNPDYHFEEADQAIEQKWEMESEDFASYDDDEVARFLELFPQTRSNETIIPTLGWVYASLYAPYIRDIEGELPSLMVYGDAGAGKTATLGAIREGLGMSDNPESARDTKFAMVSSLSSTNSIPIWMDEYKPSAMRSYQVDMMQDGLRRATRGATDSRGTQDQGTNTYEFTAPIVLSGEQRIQGTAERRRMIQIQYSKEATKEGTGMSKAFSQLTGGSYTSEDGLEYTTGVDPTHHAAAIHRHVLSTSNFQSEWESCKKQVFDVLSAAGIGGIDDLELVALTMIKYGMNAYQSLAKDVDADMASIVSNDEVNESITSLAEDMGESSRASHVDEFIKLVAQASRAGFIDHGEHYRLVRANKPNEELRLKLPLVHARVSKYIDEHNIAADLFDNPADYKSRMKDRVDADGSYVLGISVITQDLNRCVSIDSHRAEEAVDGFDRGDIMVEAQANTSKEVE